MAITTSGSISIKEAAGAANSIDTEVSAVSSGSLVTLSQNSINYTGSTRGAVSTKDTDASPYGMLEFSGYAHTSVGTWPDFEPSTWGTFASSYHQTTTPGLDAEGFCSMTIKRDDANSRIEIKTYSGTAAAMATVYTNYITYTGMTDPTYSVKYNQSSGINSGNNGSSNNNPLEAGLNVNQFYGLAANNASRQFKWIAQRTANGGDGLARVTAVDMVFTLRIQSNEGDSEYPVWVNYDISSTSRGVSVSARRGIEP